MNVLQYLEECNHYEENLDYTFKMKPQEYSYKKEKLYKVFKSMFERFCPYRKGDLVKLIKTPEITPEKSWGWLGYKHFLVEGNLAIVVDRDYSPKFNLFTFGLKFENDSYIHYETKEVILTEFKNRSIFWFDESYLSKVEENVA